MPLRAGTSASALPPRPHRRPPPRPHRHHVAPSLRSALLLLLVCLGSARFNSAQQNPQGIAVWEPSESKMQPMLARPPSKQALRYDRLRRYFSDFGCIGSYLSDTVLEHDTRHPALVCTLPGSSSRTILVTASYERRDVFRGASNGWPEAVMLPMLYHALRAQPRRDTFLFAELAGDHALPRLLAHLRSADPQLPLAWIDLTRLGFGPPGFSTAPDDTQPAPVRPNNDIVRMEAWRILHLQHIDPTRTSVPSAFVPTPDFAAPQFVAEGSKGIPGILVYSSPNVLPGQDPRVTLPAFRQNYDFLAFYLADLDLKCNGNL